MPNQALKLCLLYPLSLAISTNMLEAQCPKNKLPHWLLPKKKSTIEKKIVALQEHMIYNEKIMILLRHIGYNVCHHCSYCTRIP